MPFRLVLAGHYAGKTVLLNNHQFIKGVLTLKEPIEKCGHLINYFKTYNAHLEGSDDLAFAQAEYDLEKGVPHDNRGFQIPTGADHGGSDSDKPGAERTSERGGHDGAPGSGTGDGLVPIGSGVQEGRLESGAEPPTFDTPQKRLAKVVRALDPNVVEHWTGPGKPLISAIETVLGSTGITRAEVEAAAPGWNRDEAMKLWRAAQK